MSEDKCKWIVKTEKNQAPADGGGDEGDEKTMVYAGWKTAAKGSWPARVDGWSIVFSVEQETLTSVSGRLVFPERAAFEFVGNLKEMTRALEQIEGARAAFAIGEFTFVRDCPPARMGHNHNGTGEWTMAMKQLNAMTSEILAVLEARHHPAYVAEKRAALVGLDKAEALFWATLKLDDMNLASLAERLGVGVSDLKTAGRVLRSVC